MKTKRTLEVISKTKSHCEESCFIGRRSNPSFIPGLLRQKSSLPVYESSSRKGARNDGGFLRPFVVIPILAVLFITAAFGQGKKPSWVEKRPTAAGYYHGIGSAPKTGTPQEYMQRAKDAALNDIAQQIVVSIDAEQMSKLSEKMGELSEEYQTAVKTSTKADLDDVETVDTWDGGDNYWVYYRLSIETYRKNHAEKLRKASSLGLDFYSKGKSAEKNGNITEALQSYVQGLSALEKFLGEPIEVQYAGSSIFLSNELFSSLQSLLNQVELKAKNPKLDAQVGKPIRQPLDVMATNSAANAPVQNFPVKFSFVKGEGDIVASSKSDKNGIASTQVTKVTATDKLQLIKAEADPASLAGQNASPLLQTLLKGFSVPSARFTLNVTFLSVAFETEEMMLGTKLRLPRIEPMLKNSLSSQGFTFVDDPSKANLMISIKSNGRDGGEYNGLYTIYVDANISVLDLNSGEEVYKTSLNNVKGVSINNEKAGMKAYDEIAAELQKKAIPKILEQLKK
ncbi:MAG: LPP20 family lipoprotein [Bacteroidota bacterium]